MLSHHIISESPPAPPPPAPVQTQFILPRTDGIKNVSPTAAEVPLPEDGMVSTVFLNDGTIEYWTRTAGAWVLAHSGVLGSTGGGTSGGTSGGGEATGAFRKEMWNKATETITINDDDEFIKLTTDPSFLPGAAMRRMNVTHMTGGRVGQTVFIQLEPPSPTSRDYLYFMPTGNIYIPPKTTIDVHFEQNKLLGEDIMELLKIEGERWVGLGEKIVVGSMLERPESTHRTAQHVT